MNRFGGLFGTTKGSDDLNFLMGLNPDVRVRRLVTEDFRKGDPATVDATEFIVDLELGRSIDLAPLRAVVGEAMKKWPQFDSSKSDQWLAPRVHATLRLTRREAADKRIWAYLTLVEFPQYVRWRWEKENSEKPITLDRYLGEDSKNSLARLWWTAELTRNGEKYAHSELAFQVTDFSDRWQSLNLMHHRAAALGTIEFLSSFGSDGVTGAQNKTISKAMNT